ncbi:MAG TPA: VOC family protein [Spirochaetia bacterium]|nr:VOC family protein [Spirochaetia bacterium]
MQKIAPFLWFDSQAEEAAELYMALFPNSKIGNISRYGEDGGGQPGKVITLAFELDGMEFMALNGGPLFSFTPAVSFFVTCESRPEIDRIWNRLSEGGTVRMELQKYPFSDCFGWTADRFGVNWQLNLSAGKRKISPFLLFVGDQHGRVEEAIAEYVSVFENSKSLRVERYGAGEGEREGAVKHALFELDGVQFMAMESGREHAFGFNEAISFFVNCTGQDEVDGLWAKLSAGGEPGQCGWLKDRFGVSWQIVPTILGELLQDKDPAKAGRVMSAMLQMKKIDIADLKRAYEGKA